MPYLEDFSNKLNTIDGLSLEVFKVENRFFGPTVTVAGLLTGKDIVKAFAGKIKADHLFVQFASNTDQICSWIIQRSRILRSVWESMLRQLNRHLKDYYKE